MRYVTSEEIDEEGHTRIREYGIDWICTIGIDIDLKEYGCSSCETCKFSAKELINL